MLSPISWRTPPRQYGPWEWIASLLTEGLVQQGVEVDLYATGDSQTSARLRWVAAQPYSENPQMDAKVWECLHIAAVFEMAHQYDLIHNHFDFLPLTYSKLVKVPVLTTIHGFSSPKILPVYQRYNSHVAYVAISEAARHPDLQYHATIYHGIPVKDYPFSAQMGEYLLFLGRIHRDKGVYEAIQFAHRVKIPLIIAGIIQDQHYFEKHVQPYIDGSFIDFIGPVGPKIKGEVLSNARALLHLINCHEAFGLTVVEAMACGTPVVAIRRGSMPELIIDGETGFLCDDLDEAVLRFESLARVSRHCCREWVEKQFTVELMVQRYLKTYYRVIRKK